MSEIFTSKTECAPERPLPGASQAPVTARSRTVVQHSDKGQPDCSRASQRQTPRPWGQPLCGCGTEGLLGLSLRPLAIYMSMVKPQLLWPGWQVLLEQPGPWIFWLPAGTWQTHYEGFVILFKPRTFLNTSAIGRQAFQIIRWQQDTTLGEMNALAKMDGIRIPNEIWVGKMCWKEKRFQKNRCSVFHLRPTNNCSGGFHLFKSIRDNSVVWVPKTQF